MIAAVGETVEDVCKAVAWLGDEDVAIHDDLLRVQAHSQLRSSSPTTSRRTHFNAENGQACRSCQGEAVSSESSPSSRSLCRH